MAGLWSRIKSWLQNENLSNSDLNAEFNNLISQIAASTISGASNYPATVAGMRATESPGSVGSEVLPVTIQDEIQQLRYLLVQITGNTYWYSAPATTIAALSSTISNLYTIPQSRIVSGRIDTNDQPMYLVPNGAAATVSFKGASTNAAVYTNNNSRTVSSDINLTGLTTAPSSNNTCAINDASLAGAQATKTQGEGSSVITINSIGSNISALNGTYAAFKVSTEYFLAEVDTTNNQLKNCFRGFGFNSSDTWQARVAISNGNTITLMKLAYIFLEYSSSTFSLGVSYTKPTVSYTAPSSPAIGDRWYDLVNKTWKSYSGIAWTSLEAVFAGYAICDSSNCVAARSAHFFKIFSNLNTIELEYVSSTSVRANKLDTRINSYGTTYYYDLTQPLFSTSSNLDSGVSLSPSTSYWCYITDLGDVKISDVAPTINKRSDLYGSYHPAKPWRCVGTFNTDGSSNITSTTVATIDPLDELKGGTNQSIYQVGDTLYASASNALSKLPGNTAATNKYYRQVGTGSVSAAPTWADLPTPTVQKFTATGATTGYLFTISTSSTCAVGDTYTNNAQTFTVQGALSAQSGQVFFATGTGAPAASGNLIRASGAGTATIAFTSFITLGTYTTPANTAYIRVRIVGGGGGGMSGGTTATAAVGTAGTNSVFGTNLISANGGGGGSNATTNGGTASLGSGPIGFAFTGAYGGGWVGNNTAATFCSGGYGGGSPFGGGGIGQPNGAGVSPVANTGGGGGGGGSNGATGCYGGQGGGGGGYVDAFIIGPASTYFYAIGTGGAGGGAGTSGFGGAQGATGYLVVEEYPK